MTASLAVPLLGARGSDDAELIASLLPALARPLSELRTTQALWLPPRRPGVLALALADDPGLLALQRDLVAALADTIGFVPEHRRYRPHVTLARLKRDATAPARGGGLAPAAVTFSATALTLYRSHTGGGGTRYEPLARAGLQLDC